MGNYQMALELYEKIHVDYPDNLECEHLSRAPALQHSSNILTNRRQYWKVIYHNNSSDSSMNTDVLLSGNLVCRGSTTMLVVTHFGENAGNGAALSTWAMVMVL